MAYRKSESGEYATLKAADYHRLLRDHLLMKALRIAGIEKEPVFKAVEGLMNDPRVETHIRPVKKNYR